MIQLMAYQMIIGRKVEQEPNKTSVRGRTFSWRRGVDIITVTLECGHQKVYRGNAPKRKAQCEECERP